MYSSRKCFFTLTERKNILKPKALIHIFNTCFLLCVTHFYHKSKESKFECFVTDTYYPLELGTEIIQFDDQGRIFGAHRRKFVKNQIKPK